MNLLSRVGTTFFLFMWFIWINIWALQIITKIKTRSSYFCCIIRFAVWISFENIHKLPIKFDSKSIIQLTNRIVWIT